jgi:transposase
MLSIRKEWSTPKKARFRALVEDAGWSCRAAASKLGIPKSTAHAWLRQEDERRTGKYRPGRPRAITPEQINAIEKWFPGYYQHRAASLDEIIQVFNLNCHPATLHRELDKIGIYLHILETKPWVSEKNKAKRLEFAKKYRKRPKSFWQQEVYTDESTCNTQI